MTDDDDPRQAAIGRLKTKRAFWQQVGIYVIVNAMLTAIWAFGSKGFFWPGFVMLFWGVGLVAQAWALWGQKPISEDAIEREMKRGDEV